MAPTARTPGGRSGCGSVPGRAVRPGHHDRPPPARFLTPPTPAPPPPDGRRASVARRRRASMPRRRPWMDQRRPWMDQRRPWMDQRRAWMDQRRAWMDQQRAWMDQRRAWMDQRRPWMDQRRPWMDQQRPLTAVLEGPARFPPPRTRSDLPEPDGRRAGGSIRPRSAHRARSAGGERPAQTRGETPPPSLALGLHRRGEPWASRLPFAPISADRDRRNPRIALDSRRPIRYQ